MTIISLINLVIRVYLKLYFLIIMVKKSKIKNYSKKQTLKGKTSKKPKAVNNKK